MNNRYQVIWKYITEVSDLVGELREGFPEKAAPTFKHEWFIFYRLFFF